VATGIKKLREFRIVRNQGVAQGGEDPVGKSLGKKARGTV